MTDNTQPEALRLANLCSNLTRYSMDAHLIAAELRRQHDRIAELESELEAVGAGGVSGPLMGQPQAMPDLSALTERGAKAWAGVDAQGLREGRWYMVTHDGVATLCEDRRDAEEEAKAADMAWPYSGPHRAVQLVEASMAGYTAADMATAAAFARAVLAKWGTPAVAGEPDYATFALWYADHIGDENKPVRDAALATYEAFATPQPTQAQAGAVPLTDEQIQDLLLCGNPTDEEMRLIRIGWDAVNGIKGGQHG